MYKWINRIEKITFTCDNVCVLCTFVRLMFRLCINSPTHSLTYKERELRARVNRELKKLRYIGRPADRHTLLFKMYYNILLARLLLLLLLPLPPSRTRLFDWQMPLVQNPKREWRRTNIDREIALAERIDSPENSWHVKTIFIQKKVARVYEWYRVFAFRKPNSHSLNRLFSFFCAPRCASIIL